MENKREAVRSLMHGERKMCSVCEIAKETGLDTEEVKPLMVEIAMEPVKNEPVRKSRSFTDKQLETMKQLWIDGKCMYDIALAIKRNYQSTRHKLRQMQQDGILPKRNGKGGEQNAAD